MSDPVPGNPLSPEAEEALFQRLLLRLGKARQEVAAGAEVAASAADWVAAPAKETVDHSATAFTALTAQRIVEGRRNKKEPVSQLLFRVPESLRDEVRRLSVDERRQMDELLTEAVLDLLLKHGRTPSALQKHASQDVPG